MKNDDLGLNFIFSLLSHKQKFQLVVAFPGPPHICQNHNRAWILPFTLTPQQGYKTAISPDY